MPHLAVYLLGAPRIECDGVAVGVDTRRERVEGLLPEIESQLSPKVFAAAHERGKRATWAALIEEARQHHRQL